MIIDYNFFGYKKHGNVWDTAIPTSHIDEVVVGAGIYDEIFVSVDTAITEENVKPGSWQLKTIMNPKFESDLEAGSIGNDGHEIKHIQIYRKEFLKDDPWMMIGQFEYTSDYNVYSFTDRLTENGKRYIYGLVPVSKDVVGQITESEPILVDYNGVFLTDANRNYQMEVDFEMGQIDHNNNVSVSNPLNGRYPIVTYGNQDYKTGTINFLPLTDIQIRTGGTRIDGQSEREYQDGVLKFLKNGSAKVIRNDNGNMIVVAVHNVSETSRNGNLIDLNDLSFQFTEIGELDFQTLSKGGLIGTANGSRYTFDENGNIIWAINYLEDTQDARREFRNSPPQRLRDERDGVI